MDNIENLEKIDVDELFAYLLDQYAKNVDVLSAEEISDIDSRSTQLANIFAKGGLDLRNKDNAKKWLAGINSLFAVVFATIVENRGGDTTILDNDENYTKEDFTAIGFELWSIIVDLNYLIYVNNRGIK